MSQKKFTITAREANLLDRVARATKMAAWFWIKKDPETHEYIPTDLDGEVDSPEEVIACLECGTAYDLTQVQGGGFTPEEVREIEAVFRRANPPSRQVRQMNIIHHSKKGNHMETNRFIAEINPLIGKKIRIIDMKGEPQYAGKEGVVTHIDDAGQIHGTWGGCALVEGDRYEFIDNDEEGKLPKEGPKTKYWSVPVVYEMYGSISVEAESAEEAYNKVKDHPEEFGLPEEGFYVDDSFKVADDDRENAIGTIKMLDNAPDDDAASGRHTGLTVKATVTFQKWEGDIARFNGEAEFDACDALDSMSDEELAQIERNDPYALNNVYLRAVAFGQIHDYDGPFEVDLDEDNLSDYLEARREAQ